MHWSETRLMSHLAVIILATGGSKWYPSLENKEAHKSDQEMYKAQSKLAVYPLEQPVQAWLHFGQRIAS